MLEILLLVLQIVTLILLFLFIWWVVRSARRDLVSSVEGTRAAGGQAAPRWDAGGGWSPAPSAGQAGVDWPSAAPTQHAAGDWPSSAPTERAVAGWPSSAPTQQVGSDWPSAAPTRAAAPATEAAYEEQGIDWGWPPEAEDADEPPEDTGASLWPEDEALHAAAGVAAAESRAANGEPFAARDSGMAVEPGTVAGSNARLVVESSPLLAAGQEIPLADSLQIGRTPGNDLVLGEAFVSSAHARVVRRGQGFVVEDLQSTNGTFVNERRVTEARLKPEARLRIGETVFRYEE